MCLDLCKPWVCMVGGLYEGPIGKAHSDQGQKLCCGAAGPKNFQMGQAEGHEQLNGYLFRTNSGVILSLREEGPHTICNFYGVAKN